MQQSNQRVWFAVLLIDSHFAQGAFRRSQRAHWSALDAREELNGWVDAMKLGPVVWDELVDHMYVGRVPGYFAIIASLLMPKGLAPLEQPSLG
jgi:hypothetical protein